MKGGLSELTARVWERGPITVTFYSELALDKSKTVTVSIGETVFSFSMINMSRTLPQSSRVSSCLTISLRFSRLSRKIVRAIFSRKKA